MKLPNRITIDSKEYENLLQIQDDLLEACEYVANYGKEMPSYETYLEMVSKCQQAINKAEEVNQ